MDLPPMMAQTTFMSHSSSASMSGSISRRRVGSLSQRGNDPLPPLDIQSIQMPSNPQNALALKTASLSSTKSLYQTCSTLRKRLQCVEDFQPFLDQPPTAEPLDVVSHMCHTLRLGSSLCHLYNLLIPSFSNPSSSLYGKGNVPIPNQIEYDLPQFYSAPDGVKNWAKRPEHAKKCQKYIANFCMAMNTRRLEGRWPEEMWAIHELWGKSSGPEAEAYDSTALMKVLHTVELILDALPESAMTQPSPMTPFSTSRNGSTSAGSRGNIRQSYDIPFSLGGTGPGSGAIASLTASLNGGVHISDELSGPAAIEEMARRGSKTSADANAWKSVEELVSSEKSYVQELEILVRYSNELLEGQFISNDTNHQMFSNLGKILDFHRKFLIKLETEYEPIQEGLGPKAWAEGSWGRPFVTSEAEFDCYGPYCANYLDAINIVNEQMPNLMRGQEQSPHQRPCLHPERELQAFMIKPIQRITKYGLLLEAILHATAKHDYPHRAELAEGSAAVKRIASSINEVTDFKAKQATVRELSERVEDWKGHDVEKFGDLWLDDHFIVTKADQPREYHVFLFEKMMLCCKDVVPDRKDKKSKNGSMLRKDKSLSKTGIPPRKPLALKGRIFVSNIIRAALSPAEPSDPHGASRLTISWTVPQRNGAGHYEDVTDSFTMIGRNEDQMKKWADKVMELATMERRRNDEAKQAARIGRYSATGSERGYYNQSSSFAPPTPATEGPAFHFPPPIPYHGYNGHYGDEDEDDSGFRSGRTTPSMSGASTSTHASAHPVTGRRVLSQQAMPIDRAELRARAMTEDQFGPSMTQWRSQQPVMPPLPRLASNMSAQSTTSEASFGHAASSRLLGQFSASRLGMAEEMDEEEDDTATGLESGTNSRFNSGRGMARTPSQGITSTIPYPHPASLRNRSVSSPNVYQIPPKISTGAPPIPNNWAQENQGHGQGGQSAQAYAPLGTSSSSTLVGGTAYFTKRMSGGKRSSGESHSTETSETSSQQSPATPYSNMPAEMRGPTPVSRQNSGDGFTTLLRIRNGDNAFVIGVTADINFQTLHQKVMKKLRISGGVPAAGGLQLKWIDADDDQITLRCDADVEAMFWEMRDSGMTHVNLIAR